jgi:DNA-directed RNA polymerase sigma subunit (sigma70/sigma32)
MIPDRYERMLAQWIAGETLKQIGAAHGVTRERVRQVIHRMTGRAPRTVSTKRAEQLRYQQTFRVSK